MTIKQQQDETNEEILALMIQARRWGNLLLGLGQYLTVTGGSPEYGSLAAGDAAPNVAVPTTEQITRMVADYQAAIQRKAELEEIPRTDR